MPTRRNPYHSSGQTYGSGGLAPRYYGGTDVATPLANLVANIADVALYDPAMDPQRQSARLHGLQADEIQTTRTGRENVAGALEKKTPFPDIAPLAIRGGMKPEEVGQLGNLASALADPNDPFYTRDRQDRLFVASGGAPSGTYNRDALQPAAIIDPVTKLPKTVSQEKSIEMGAQPVLEESKVKGSMLAQDAANLSGPQRRAVYGAEPKESTPYNYVLPDGTVGSTTSPGSVAGPGVQVYSGQVSATSPGGLRPTVQGGLQERSIEEQRFGQMLDYAEGLGTKAEDSDFGVVGNTKRLIQDGMQQGRGLTQFLGVDAKDVDSAYATAMQTAQANGINPAQFQFDPNLDKLGKIGTLLIFNAASIFANQSGRSVSDKDVTLMRKYVGDPTQMMSSKAQFLNGISSMRDILGMSKQTTDQRLGGKGAAPAAPAAPAPAAPAAAAPAVGTVEEGYQFNGGDPSVPANWTPVQ